MSKFWVKLQIYVERKTNEHMVKLQRAQGECLGTGSRRRTQRSAISHGEAKAAIDPWISEWGNPAGADLSSCCESNSSMRGTA